jgi:glutathione S-transferase
MTAMTASVTAFAWVPPFAQGFVRDHRIRWAHEEIGRPYDAELVDRQRLDTPQQRARQPFGQVPAYRDAEGVELFESGAIVLHIAASSDGVLAPKDAAGFAQVSAWVFAAVSSVEPHVQTFAGLDGFHDGAAWVAGYRPGAEAALRRRLDGLEAWLAGKDYLCGRFTAADIMMATVLRELEDSDVLAGYPAIAAYQDRCLARPAWRRALAAQLATFEANAPSVAQPA